MKDGFKACPYCAEPVREAATICRYCNRTLGPSSPPAVEVSSEKLAPLPTSKPGVFGELWNTWLGYSYLRRLFYVVGTCGIFLLAAIVVRTGLDELSHVRNMLRSSPSSARRSGVSDSSIPNSPPPPPVPVVRSIVNGNVEVAPQQFRYFTFIVPDAAQNARVVGVFHAFGGSGNDIEVAIMTPFEFENWRNGHQANVYYSSGGKTTNGAINIEEIPPGTYTLAFSNVFSQVSRKEVTAHVTLMYTVQPGGEE